MSDVRTETRLAKIVHIVNQGFAGPLEVVINQGAHQGVKRGDKFLVFGIGPRIVDPDTREDLGELELVRGRGEIVHVQEHIATLRTIERRRTRPAKRVVRETGGGFGLRGNIIEEELAAEAEMPFEDVRLGDIARPI